MDAAIVRYAQADPLFYDQPGRGQVPRTRRFAVAEDRDWTGWDRRHDHPWVHWHPRGLLLPRQGWKVHVSATPDDAQDVLRLVAGFCHGHGLAFKHQAGEAELVASNSKDADRAAAGKFVTIYPEDDDRLYTALTGLDALVGGRPGPYILSDLRWNDGPVYVRYGAYTRAWTRDQRGQRILALCDPAGELVEDRREPAFTPPSWAPMPTFLRHRLDAFGDTEAPDDFGYTITRGLHHSNAGGVYEATDRDGARVVLKEGRPYAGLTPDGRDGATRIADEEASLRALAAPDVVPVRDALTLHGHRFLVLEHVDGVALNSEAVRRSPAARADSTSADRFAYRQWAVGVAERVERALCRIHAAGYVHGDLHPRNVIVTPGGGIVLLDFEMSRRADDHEASLIGAPGFVPPDGRGGPAADRYALACLKLFLFCPLTPLLTLDPHKADDLLEHARVTYALDDSFIDAIRADLRLPAGHPTSRLADAVDQTVRTWDLRSEDAVAEVQAMISRSLDAAADYSRADRIWPGDPQQFTDHPAALAHGAAGVIHALDAAGLDADAQALDWLDDATARGPAAGADTQVGLFDGLAGVGWLHRLHGRDREADEILTRVRAVDLSALRPDLYGGLPGIGLYLLSEPDHPSGAGGDLGLLADAEEIARLLRDHHDRRDPPDPGDPAPVVRTDHAGLMWGSTGTALFALRLYERTGDPDHLSLAIDTLDYDLAHCIVADDGSLQINEGWRIEPYLAAGSAGIGLVAAQLMPLVPDPEHYRLALDGLTVAACSSFTIEPGLFYGRAGMIHYLVALARLGLATPITEAALANHVDALKLHALRHRTGIGFPGRGLLRMSCDLARGSAGVLTALQAYSLLAFDEHRPGWNHLLPLLLPSAPSTIPSPLPARTVERR